MSHLQKLNIDGLLDDESNDLTDSIQNKIFNINDSIECIKDELFKIQLYNGLLSEFVKKYSSEINNEFMTISKKIDTSIQVINDKTFVLEINKLKKIIKSESGRIIEMTTPHSVPSGMKKFAFDENDDVSNDSDNSDEYYNDDVTITHSMNRNDIGSGSKILSGILGTGKYKNRNIKIGGNPEPNLNPSIESELSNKILKRNQSSPNDLSEDYLDKIDFDVNIYNSKKILCSIALNIFKKNFDLVKIKIELGTLKEFIRQVSLYYHNNPYHNFKHAVSVLQFVSLLINKISASKFLSEYELFGLFVAALVHDIDHPGHTNMFEINYQSNLALKYNDKSVLENHHCHLAFFLMHSTEIQLLKNLDQSSFSTVREMIIECILSTDMKYHIDLVSDLGNKYHRGFTWDSLQDRIFFAKIIIHTADLSNQMRPFDVSYKGSIALRREFAEQVNMEEKLKLPSQSFMKLNDDKKFYSSEHLFSSNVVKPMWNILVEMFPNLEEYYLNLENNIVRWKEMSNQI